MLFLLQFERMQERDISRADVKKCVLEGEIIEDYPDDFPHPSCLIFGYTINDKIIHVIAGSMEKYLYYYSILSKYNQV